MHTGVGCHFRPRDWTWVSRIAGRFCTIWAIRVDPPEANTPGRKLTEPPHWWLKRPRAVLTGVTHTQPGLLGLLMSHHTSPFFSSIQLSSHWWVVLFAVGFRHEQGRGGSMAWWEKCSLFTSCDEQMKECTFSPYCSPYPSHRAGGNNTHGFNK